MTATAPSNVPNCSPIYRPARGALARFGMVANMAILAAIFLGLPLYAGVALVAGAGCVVADLLTAQWRRGARVSDERRQRRTLTVNAQALDLEHLARAIRRRFGAGRGDGPVRLRQLNDRLVISLRRDAVFADAGFGLSPAGRGLVVGLGDTLSAAANRIDVVGYADSFGAGPDAWRGDGQEPSLARAAAVAETLCLAGGIPRIAAFGAERRGRELAREADSTASLPGVDVVIRRLSHEARHAA